MVDSYSGIISALSYNHYINKTVQFFLVVNMSAECIACQNPVRAREQGLQCEGCRFRWQHCTCGTGISQCDYSFAVQTGASIDWRCVTCLFMSLSESTPVAESTPVDFTESMSTLYEPLADSAESTLVDLTESMSTLHEPIANSAESTLVDFTESMSTLHEPLANSAESSFVDFTESMSTLHEPIADSAESTLVDFTESMSTLHEPIANSAESTLVDFTESMSTLHEPLANSAESTLVDFTESMSILHEPLADPAADESSNLEPLPAPVTLSPSKSGKTALRRRKGKPKLIDSRYYCYNIKRRGGNPTDWQCTVKRKVTVLKLSYALPVFTREV